MRKDDSTSGKVILTKPNKEPEKPVPMQPVYGPPPSYRPPEKPVPKQQPVPQQQPIQPVYGPPPVRRKKGLFSWLRKKDDKE